MCSPQESPRRVLAASGKRRVVHDAWLGRQGGSRHRRRGGYRLRNLRASRRRGLRGAFRAAGGRALARQTDIGDEGQIRTLVDEAVAANAVAPGLVRTARNFEVLEDEDTLPGIMSIIRSPRVGKPDDIAAMVAFLASDDGEYVNGQVIAVDGGSTMR